MNLCSYIAPGAPATRRPESKNEALFRAEIGFTPKWYRKSLGIDFGETWHYDPSYKKKSVLLMRELLCETFPGHRVGYLSKEPDLLTGVMGGCTIAGIFEILVIFAKDNWPT